MYVTACDYEENGTQWFEMERSGDTVFEFCIDGVCFNDSDTARSEDSVCS